MSVTSREVAKLAQVSQATVSRVLSGRTRVADDTSARVLAAAKALGYVRNELGRNLRTSSARQIAIVTDLENRLYPSLMPTLHDRFGDAGYRIILMVERPEHSDLVTRLVDRSIDGVVLTTTFLDSELPGQLRRHGVPFAYLNRVHGSVASDSATVDNRSGAAELARLLLGLGHRRIGAVFSSTNTSTGRDREDGFRDALAREGVALHPDNVFHGWYSYEHGIEGMSHLLRSAHRPTAVFCASDFIAVGAMAEAKRQGLRIPEDLSVVGFDDLDVASWPWLELTTVATPLAQMAEAATRMLLERLGDPTAELRQQLWPAQVVLRQTHAQPPGRR